MACITFVAAEPLEFRGLLRRLREVRRLPWPVAFARSGKLGSLPVLLLANGPGSELASEALEAALQRVEMRAVVSTGFCGALSADLQTGDVFVGTVVKEPGSGDLQPALMPAARRAYRKGTLLTVGHVVQQTEEKRRLLLEGADAVDMEAAAVAACARRWSLPFYCVRVVLDSSDEGFSCDFNAARDARGRFSGWRLLCQAGRRPNTVGRELIRLRFRGRRSAAVLGEFLAACQF